MVLKMNSLTLEHSNTYSLLSNATIRYRMKIFEANNSQLQRAQQEYNHLLLQSNSYNPNQFDYYFSSLESNVSFNSFNDQINSEM